MEQTKFQDLKDKAFGAKSEIEWVQVMQEIKTAVVGDDKAADAIRDYCKKILPKKREWWSKQSDKPKFNNTPKMLLSPDTDKAIGELARTLTKYLEFKMNTTTTINTEDFF